MKTKSQAPSCDRCLMNFDLYQTSLLCKIFNKINISVCHLSVHSISVPVCSDDCKTLCMWPENFASWGSSELSCCLFKVLTEPQDIINKTNCTVFSDWCERNNNTAIYILCCATVCTEMCIDINHSFLVHGHTVLPSDRHCGLRETEAGKSDIAKHSRFNPLNT
jgi:hypothetical protein